METAKKEFKVFGEWQVEKAFDDMHDQDIYKINVVNHDEVLKEEICTVWTWTQEEEAEKYANIIASAPKILEALQEANKDLIILHGNIHNEIKAGRTQWEGVEEIIYKRIESNKSAISSALGE